MKITTAVTCAAVLLSLMAAPLWAKVNVEELASQCNAGKKGACQNLEKLATRDKDPFVRSEAAKYVTDQAVLTTIVLHDPDLMVRTSVVVNITDQSVLEKVAQGDSDSTVRMVAISKLTTQAVLAQIAIHDTDARVRGLAAEKVTDPALAADIAADAARRTLLRKPVLDYLATVEMPGWTNASAETQFDSEVVDAGTGRATLKAEVAFTGGRGLGVQFNSGSRAFFGATVGPDSGLPMYGVTVFGHGGKTYMLVPQTFLLHEENGVWTIIGREPENLQSPPFSPM